MNPGKAPMMVIHKSCETIAQLVLSEMAAAGIRTLKSFDLQAARAARPDALCPIHGAHACSCQMIIILLFGSCPDASTLILEGQAAATAVYLDASSDRCNDVMDLGLTAALMRALLPACGQPESS